MSDFYNRASAHKLGWAPSWFDATEFDEELTEKRREAGAVIESAQMTPISDDYFTNYPDAFIKN